MHKYLIIVCFLLITNSIFSQSCYIQLSDLSGFDTSPYQVELESAACALKSSLPEQYQNEFKVFDFGFYRINEYTLGEFETVWERTKLNVQQQSPFYLLFGKITTTEGIYTQIRVDFNLPDMTDGCFVRDAFIKENLMQILNADSNPFTYADREIQAMQTISMLGCEICGNEIDDDGDGYIDCYDLDCISTNESLQNRVVKSRNPDICYLLSETCINSIGLFIQDAENDQWLKQNIEILDWGLSFMSEYGCTEEVGDFVLEAFNLKRADEAIILDQIEELYNLTLNNSNVFFEGCFQDAKINEQDYAHLFNHSLPQECTNRLNSLGDEFYYQDLDDAHSPAINMDHYSTEISIIPDFDGDGTPDDSNVLFEKIREEFLTLASGSKDDFKSNCIFGLTPDIWWNFQNYPGFNSPNSTERWLSNDPITTIFLIDAGAAGPIDDAVADLGAVMVSDITGCCWIFSTVATPASGSQPFSGHRQFGMRTNERGNLEFFTRAVDRAKLTSFMKFLVNDACSIKDYFDIGDVTWSGLMESVTAFIVQNGGQANVYRGDFIRPNYEDVKIRLTSDSPIEINCN